MQTKLSGLLAFVSLLGAMCLPIAAANAATVTESFSFSASDFGNGSPVDPWTGSFTITFDPTIGFQEGALDAFSSNLPAGYGTFTFLHTGGNLEIGDACSSLSCIVVGGADHADLDFSPVTASGGLTFLAADITSTSAPATVFTASNGTVTQTPLPAALPLFVSGLGALGMLGWRRKRRIATV